MSQPASFDVEEQLARIARMREETQKFSEETRKLIEESRKLSHESLKYSAEARKYARDTAIAPWQIVLTAMTAGAALFGAGVAFIKLLGT